jgi:hypothetical protein
LFQEMTMKIAFRSLTLFIFFLTLILAGISPVTTDEQHAFAQGQAPDLTVQVFIPLAFNPIPVRVDLPSTLRINAPYFSGVINYDEMAIAWFGKVTSTQNYADIRVGYNNTELYVDLAIFDRYLSFTDSPTRDDLTHWDAASLYLNSNGNQGETAGQGSFLFVAQLNWAGARQDYQAAYRGTGSSWGVANLPFTTETAWRGEGPNDPSIDDRGWITKFHIPFSSLGVSNPPADGTTWGMSIVLHDRESDSNLNIANQSWPPSADENRPSTWGQLRFGMPIYQPPASSPGGTVTIRQGLNGAVVPDAAVGGTIGEPVNDSLCPGDPNVIWSSWGTRNFTGTTGINIQNQVDVSDWPCFAKYFLTFPLSQIQAGKVIRSAKLIMHHWGGSDPTAASPSYLQVLMVNGSWTEGTINWNNAPLALENISGQWEDVYSQNPPDWPGRAVEWDISLAADLAYRQGIPLQLAVYSADGPQHSGKYFTTSDMEDWDAAGRPTLIVDWGNPR